MTHPDKPTLQQELLALIAARPALQSLLSSDPDVCKVFEHALHLAKSQRLPGLGINTDPPIVVISEADIVAARNAAKGEQHTDRVNKLRNAKSRWVTAPTTVARCLSTGILYDGS